MHQFLYFCICICHPFYFRFQNITFLIVADCCCSLLSTLDEDNKRLVVVSEAGVTEVDTVRCRSRDIIINYLFASHMKWFI